MPGPKDVGSIVSVTPVRDRIEGDRRRRWEGGKITHVSNWLKAALIHTRRQSTEKNDENHNGDSNKQTNDATLPLIECFQQNWKTALFQKG